MILLRADVFERVIKITANSGRLLTVTATGSACEEKANGKCWLKGKTFVLGSHHFSSGHAGTTIEFDENIFFKSMPLPADDSGLAAADAITAGSLVRILGGDLNTDPRDEKDARGGGGDDTLPQKAAKAGLALAGPPDQRPTYAKRLSILQTQFTKAERLDVDAIDHVYVSRGFGVSLRPLPSQVRAEYGRAAKALGLGTSGLCPDATSCGYFPSMKDYKLLPNEGAHALALSDHIPIALRVRIDG